MFWKLSFANQTTNDHLRLFARKSLPSKRYIKKKPISFWSGPQVHWGPVVKGCWQAYTEVRGCFHVVPHVNKVLWHVNRQMGLPISCNQNTLKRTCICLKDQHNVRKVGGYFKLPANISLYGTSAVYHVGLNPSINFILIQVTGSVF